jgi:hypothetical protein
MHISKEGDAYLRTLLVQGAHYILGLFGQDSDLRRWGLKLAERGGKNAEQRAVIAVARKLAVLLHKLWVSGEVYEPLRNNHEAVSAVAQRGIRATELNRRDQLTAPNSWPSFRRKRGAKVDYQVAAPTVLGTPTMHRAKIAQRRVRMEGWRQGGRARTQRIQRKERKNALDSCRPSHGVSSILPLRKGAMPTS